eukprot:TRINITY_DN9589_c0_g1_i7.p1 TRINITY_DN9589_c0_g1~~TRINITY_DN9589_c0_g1_i7.p1  ORF type:complete len:405 (+),score=105.68 TRINITY_DN9589_c0_g1_i7:175-1389(+)
MASAYLEQQIAKAAGTNAEVWQQLENLYTRKLWHQVTVKLLDIINDDMFANGGLLELYESFLTDFSSRINPVSFVNISLVIATQIATPADALEFLANIETQVKQSKEALVLIMASQAELYLRTEQLEQSKTVLKEALVYLDDINGVTEMHGAYYRVAAEYHKHTGDFAAFYINALRFLGCIEVDTLPVDEQVQRAFDLSLAALLGKGIYNFGELLSHPIIKVLNDTDKSWVIELLYAFNAGDLAKFSNLSSTWEGQPDLKSNAVIIQEKIRLLALMEAVFKSPPHKRDLSFERVAEAAQVSLDQVEHLVMRALALGLVRGTLDQVGQVAKLNWVQPRVLDLAQVRYIMLLTLLRSQWYTCSLRLRRWHSALANGARPLTTRLRPWPTKHPSCLCNETTQYECAV